MKGRVGSTAGPGLLLLGPWGRWPPGSLNVWSGQALDRIQKGKITDGKSIIVLYWGEKYLAGEWNP